MAPPIPKDSEQMAPTKPVHDLMNADARAILDAVERGNAKVSLLDKTVEKLVEEVASNSKDIRAAWAMRTTVGELKTSIGEMKLLVAGQRESLGDLAQQVGACQAATSECAVAVVECATSVKNLATMLESERMQRQQADKRIEGQVKVVQARGSQPSHSEFSKPPVAHAVSSPLVVADVPGKPGRGSLADVQSWEEISSVTLAKVVLDRAKADADFAQEAARAGLGLRVMTWKSIVKWVGIIILAIAGGTGIGAALQEKLSGSKEKKPDLPELPHPR